MSTRWRSLRHARNVHHDHVACDARPIRKVTAAVSIAVLTVNRDNGQDAEQFVKAIERLPTTFKLRPLAKDATNEQIREMMFAKDYKFALILREGFSNRINHGIGPKDEKMLELLINSSVTAQTQMVLKGALEANLAKLRLDKFVERLGGVLETVGIDKAAMKTNEESPIDLRYLYRGNRSFKAPSAVQQSVPAWLVFSMFFIVIPLSAHSSLKGDREP